MADINWAIASDPEGWMSVNFSRHVRFQVYGVPMGEHYDCPVPSLRGQRGRHYFGVFRNRWSRSSAFVSYLFYLTPGPRDRLE
jgi:hypothetical protein